jgi:hypothetical protein
MLDTIISIVNLILCVFISIILCIIGLLLYRIKKILHKFSDSHKIDKTDMVIT